jgi:Mn2+/Fe2+ NRAMP family transporter
VLQVFLPYERYVRWLKWLTLSLFAYVAVVLTLRIDWVAVARAVVWPQLTTDHQVFLTVVAVLGTTISPYLFFWQASQEVEDKKPGVHSAEEVRLSPAAHPHRHGDRHGLLGAGGVLHHAGHRRHAVRRRRARRRDRRAGGRGAAAGGGRLRLPGVRPGIIGTGMLAVPVLAGSAAYAVAGAAGWHGSLSQTLRRGEGRGFYSVIAASTVGG